MLEAEGWPDLDDAIKKAFAGLLRQLERAGISLIRRIDHPFVEALERTIANGRAIGNGITSCYQCGILDAACDGMSARAKATLDKPRP